MPPVQAPTVKGNGAPNGAKGDTKKVAIVPFTRASREKTKQAFRIPSTTLDAAAPTPANPIQLPAGGFLKWVDLDLTVTTAANAANVTFATDGPWNVISFVDLKNSAGDSVIVPFNGFQLFLINKYGALGIDPPACDPRLSPIYSVTTGAGATGGSFRFFLRVPLEQDPRDALTAVPNLAANKSYFLQINFNASDNVYGTAPTTPGDVAVFGLMGYWSQPNGQNVGGTQQMTTPFGNGSVSLWRFDQKTIAAGDILSQLLNVGNVIRMAIFVLRDNTGARMSAANWSDTSQIILNDDILYLYTRDLWRHYEATDYGYTGTIDTGGGLDTGVWVLSDWMNQRGKVYVDGPRDQYLVTYKSTLLQIRNTSFGANATTLEIITNDIKPTSPAALYSPNIV